MKELRVGDVLCKIGGNADENWDLIRAAKRHHWFFHLTDFPSPYVVLECDRAEPSAHTKEQCAELCVEHSKHRRAGKVKVDATPCGNVRVDRKDDVGECDYKNEGKVEIIVVRAAEKPGRGGAAAGGRARETGPSSSHENAPAVVAGREAGPTEGQYVSIQKGGGAGGWAKVTFKDAAVRNAILRERAEIVAHGGIKVRLQPQIDPKTKVESKSEIFASWGRKAEGAAAVAESDLLRCFESLAEHATAAMQESAPREATGEHLRIRKAAVGGCAVVTVDDPQTRQLMLDLRREVTISDLGVVVRLQPQVDPQTKEEVPTALFASWGRKVEAATPVSEEQLLRCMEGLRVDALASDAPEVAGGSSAATTCNGSAAPSSHRAADSLDDPVVADAERLEVQEVREGSSSCNGSDDLAVSVCLPSGDFLMEHAHFRPSDKLSALLHAADQNLRSLVAPEEGNVSALCSSDGRVLDSNHSFSEACVMDGAVLTAVVNDDEAQLAIIERHFHDLIMSINRCTDNPSKLTDKGFEFPSLKGLAAGSGRQFYPVPGMYGGFITTLEKLESGWTLSTRSFCRIVEGSEESHEITVHGVQRR